MTGTIAHEEPRVPVSPESVGEAHARSEWECKGRALITLPTTYAKADYRLRKQSDDPMVRRAFDRVLAALAAASAGIMRPKLPKPPKPRRRS